MYRSSLPLLVVSLALLSVAGCSSSVPYRPKPVFLTPEDIRYVPAPAILPPGAEMAVLEGDWTKPGFFTVRVRMPDGYRIPPHYHPRAEHATVLSGVFNAGGGDVFDPDATTPFPAGSYAVVLPDMHHFAWVKGETVVQIQGFGPWDFVYVNPADAPRTQGR